MRETYDIVVIGGGINGCGIARDAAGRGLSVLLAEQNDLASGTSSASTKLIHGGLRYLERYAFRLVRESLKEREVLRRLAPHLVRPMRFILPHVATMRPTWLIRCGLFLYDHLAAGTLLPTQKIDLTTETTGIPLKKSPNKLTVGFEYSDCWADDARLVIVNAQDAARRGGLILPRTRCVTAIVKGAGWEITLQRGNDRFPIGARCLINATGPWANQFLQKIEHPVRQPLRLVQGSHLVSKKLYDGEHAYLLQNDDGRVVFTVPYENDWTLIGTTDRDYNGDPAAASVSAEEQDYLQNTVRRFFGETAQVVHRFCGVRALVDDGNVIAQKANRDYLLDLDTHRDAPILNIYGGKLTTYRRLAEAAMQKLCGKGKVFADAPSGDWSATSPLPGGDLPTNGVLGLASALTTADSRLTPTHAIRLARAYGTIAASLPPPGDWHCLGADLYDWEVGYLMQKEWAETAADVLWRRSTLGLRFDATATARLEQYMKAAHQNGKEQCWR